jgi:transaldolase
MNTLLQLIAYGQSYWLDNLTRGKITSGELQRRVTEQGLHGVTSNPAIFDKAISSGEDYDAQIQQLVGEGCEVHEIYESLVVADIQDACDILRPVYDASDGEDGFVSLEVSPHLVHDTVGTMAEARRLWNAVARPNVFIKIPGTPAGVPAIEGMLYEGININITLLFAIKDYEAVAQAYLRALERLARRYPSPCCRLLQSSRRRSYNRT